MLPILEYVTAGVMLSLSKINSRDQPRNYGYWIFKLLTTTLKQAYTTWTHSYCCSNAATLLNAPKCF